MNFSRFLFILLGSILPIYGYVRENIDYKENSSKVKFQNIINKFSLEFYKEISKLNPDTSLIVSPLSSQVIIGLLSTAAQGHTQAEIFNVLHMNNTDKIKSTFNEIMTKIKNENKKTLHIANKIYVKDGAAYELSPDFKSVAKNTFFSDIENVDFSKDANPAETINNWVKNQTKGKIENLLSPNSINVDTRTVLINAIYFKGKWEEPFDKGSTKKRPFYIDSLRTIDIDMMIQENYFPYAHSSELDSQIVSIPYEYSSNSSLIIVVPNKKNGLSALEKKIENHHIDDFLKSLGEWEENLIVEIPKFKIETSVDLKDIYRQLGMELIFDENDAELSGILKNKEKLYISKAVHKAFIDVNERGTEAAAVSGFTSDKIIGGQKQHFKADRPFLYMIINDRNIIFCGKYLGK